jgi:actin-related protein 6
MPELRVKLLKGPRTPTHEASGANFVPYGELPSSDQDVDGPYDEGQLPQCALVVDSGFSFTHIVPVLSGVVKWNAVVRLDIGGKLMTNYLKELISYRQWNVMEDTHVINTVKEACCYVSMDLNADQTLCKCVALYGCMRQANRQGRYYPKDNDIVLNYVLPDFSPNSSNKTGYIQDRKALPTTATLRSPEKRDKGGMLKAAATAVGEEQVLKMTNERFVVPELLFNPSAIGMQQQGLPEAIASSIARLPEEVQGLFWANVTLVGGNCNLPGLVKRLRRNLRTLAPAECFVGVRTPKEWASFASSTLTD